MARRLFFPTPRQVNLLLVVGFVSVGYALYVRYLAIEQSSVAVACQEGLNTWLCLSRRVVLALFEHSVFGTIALAAALLNLLRPSIVLFAIALAAAALGLVLYNVALAGLAVGLLVLSLARRAPSAE